MAKVRPAVLLAGIVLAGALLGLATDLAQAQQSEAIVLDMDMEGLNRYSENWQTAKEWATQVVTAEQQQWLAAHPDGRIVLPMHSGASLRAPQTRLPVFPRRELA